MREKMRTICVTTMLYLIRDRYSGLIKLFNVLIC